MCSPSQVVTGATSKASVLTYTRSIADTVQAKNMEKVEESDPVQPVDLLVDHLHRQVQLSVFSEPTYVMQEKEMLDKTFA